MNSKVIVRAKEELECLLRQSWQRRKSSLLPLLLLLMRSTARRPHWTGVRRMHARAHMCKGEGGVQKTWDQCLHSLSTDRNDAKMSTFIRTWRVLILCLIQTSVVFHLSGQNVQHYFEYHSISCSWLALSVFFIRIKQEHGWIEYSDMQKVMYTELSGDENRHINPGLL